jgi:hypothetical protein
LPSAAMFAQSEKVGGIKYDDALTGGRRHIYAVISSEGLESGISSFWSASPPESPWQVQGPESLRNLLLWPGFLPR